MLYFLFGSKTKSSRKRLAFEMKPNELESLANAADALKGLLDAFVKKGKKMDLRDKEVKTFYATFNTLRDRIDSIAKKST